MVQPIKVANECLQTGRDHSDGNNDLGASKNDRTRLVHHSSKCGDYLQQADLRGLTRYRVPNLLVGRAVAVEKGFSGGELNSGSREAESSAISFKRE